MKELKRVLGSYQKYVANFEIEVANRIPLIPNQLPRIIDSIKLSIAVTNITYLICLYIPVPSLKVQTGRIHVEKKTFNTIATNVKLSSNTSLPSQS